MPFCRGFESHRRSESVIRATLILVACNVSRVMVRVRVAAESSCVSWGAGDQCGVAGSEREKGVRAPFLGWGEWGGEGAHVTLLHTPRIHIRKQTSCIMTRPTATAV